MYRSISYGDASEDQLIPLAFGGDSAAFGELVGRYQQPVFNLCRRYSNAGDPEDAAQETFVRAFVHRSRFSPERPVLPWLLTIARRICIDRQRKGRREVLTGDIADRSAGTGPGADETASTGQELGILQDAMGTLPEGQREAIALHHLDGLAYREVAEILEVPIGTVMTWLHRGRATLKDALRRSHGAGAGARGGDR